MRRKTVLDALEIIKKRREWTWSLPISECRSWGGIELLTKPSSPEDLCSCVRAAERNTRFFIAKEGLVWGRSTISVKRWTKRSLPIFCRGPEVSRPSQGKAGFLLHRGSMMAPLILKKRRTTHLPSGGRLPKKVKAQIWKIWWKSTSGWTKSSNDREIRFGGRPFLPKYPQTDELFGIVGRRAATKRLWMTFAIRIKESQKRSQNSNQNTKRQDDFLTICNTIVNSIEEKSTADDSRPEFHQQKLSEPCFNKQDVACHHVDYITFVKLERAKVMLCATDEKIYEIGNKLGYEDSEYFSKIFKNHTGLTPTVYRQRKMMNDGQDG
jgi:two-component system response regulator YesN